MPERCSHDFTGRATWCAVLIKAPWRSLRKIPEQPLAAGYTLPTTGRDRSAAKVAVRTLRASSRMSAHGVRTTVPNNLPIPGGESIASAPRISPALCRAERLHPYPCTIAPRKRESPTTQRTRGESAPEGDTTTMRKGRAAPTENEAADVSAACTGRACGDFRVRSSSCA